MDRCYINGEQNVEAGIQKMMWDGDGPSEAVETMILPGSVQPFQQRSRRDADVCQNVYRRNGGPQRKGQ